MAKRDIDFDSLCKLGKAAVLQRIKHEEVQRYLNDYSDRMRHYCAVLDSACIFLRRRSGLALKHSTRKDITLDGLIRHGQKTSKLLEKKYTDYNFLSSLGQNRLKFYRNREDAYTCLSAKTHRLFIVMAKQKVAQKWLSRLMIRIEENQKRLDQTQEILEQRGRKAIRHQIKKEVAFNGLKVNQFFKINVALLKHDLILLVFCGTFCSRDSNSANGFC